VLPEAPVTVTCVGAEVGQVMDCLAAKQIGLVGHKAQKDKSAEFWLLGSSMGSCQAKSIAPIKPSKELKTPKQDPLNSEPSQEEIEQTERWLIEAESKDPSERGMALTNLGLAGLKDDPKVNEMLRSATKDKDPNIRIQAITGLIQREGQNVGSEIVEALKDNNADVKMAVISNLTDPDLLGIALNDNDPVIRDLATSKIETINHQQEKIRMNSYQSTN
jgi:HEAT repeats